jgi:hypothetical protein
MKKIYGFFCLALVACAVLLSSCQEDEKSPAKPGNVRFTLQPRATGDAANGRTAQNLPEGAKLYVSIENTSGEQIYNLKEVTLVSMGDYVISEPLALNTGDYVLTEFIVANEQVSYVTPREGSPLAQWVDDPLPIAFSVEDNTLAGLDVQVLPFDDDHTPQDFGYIGFDIVVAPYPYFNLSVFAPTGDAFEFIPVHAYILEGTDTLYDEVLPAGINKIAFVGDLYDDDNLTRYKLVLQQPGYSGYAKEFSIKTLRQELEDAGKNAWEVTLHPAFTFVTLYGRKYAAFEIHGPEDHLTVDWGDGTIEPIALAESSTRSITHEYEGEGSYFVSVYGSGLAKVEDFRLTFSKQVTLDHLPRLREVRMSFGQAPPVIDFTHNPELNYIELIRADVQSILLAEDASVEAIFLDGNENTFLASSLDHVLHVSYRAAVEGRVPLGALGLAGYVPPAGPLFLIVTPSPDALEELRALRDVYGWSISPDEF